MLLLVKTLIVRRQLPVICCLLSFGTASAQTIGNWTLNNTHNYANYSVPLTGFNMLPGAVTFRLYGYGVTVSSGGTSRFVLDNISIVGSLFVLPLQLSAPEASAEENGDIKITWKAVDITVGTKFSIQRSTDGSSFTNLFTSTENNNQVSQRYTFTDNTIPGSIQKIYYRVQAEEPGGTKQLSRTITVNRKISLRLNIEKIAVRGSLMQALVQTPSRGNYNGVVSRPFLFPVP